MDERDSRTVDAMEKYGGSFVQQLSKLARLADTINLAKIKMTFREYWDKYEETGRNMESKANGGV